jgi:DNA-binding transcriptional MerR regulator
VPARAAQFRDGIADIARRFGVTVKALRLYEEMGLVAPVRDANGWRTYGQVECERLHLVLLLRQLGLPLSAIAGMIDRRVHDLGSVLSVQERALIEQRRRTEEALALVRAARERIRAGETLDLETLAELVRRTSEQEMRWAPEMSEIVDRLFSAEQKERLRSYRDRPGTPADDAAWMAIFRELAPLTQTGDATSAAAQDLARRSIALIRKVAGEDMGTWDAMRSFWAQGVADPQVAAKLPIDAGQWRFLEAAIRAALDQQRQA